MSDPEQDESKTAALCLPVDLDSGVSDAGDRPVPGSVARVVSRAQAIAKRYADRHRDASVNAFLARRVKESGE